MEQRRFKMHPALLLDVIQRQAGTLSKAVLELVMNSVDAGAKVCAITLTRTSVAVDDDGRGFRGKEEVVKFFEVFGQPHEDSEKKVYGCFRMGRGQAISYGVNVWKSGGLEMRVDIKANGLDYALVPLKEPVRGCHVAIDLYDPLSNVGLAEACRDIQRMVRFVSTRVLLNGEQISVDPITAAWTHETDDGYILVNKLSSLQLYNLGVFVRDYPASQFGVGGVVVSKRALKVNFARNDAMSDCPVWRKLKKELDQYGTKDNLKKESLDDAGRQHMIDKLVHGEIAYDEVKKLRIIRDVNGRSWSIQGMLGTLWDRHRVLTAADEGSRVGCRLHDAELAFVVSKETLDQFGCPSIKAFKSAIDGAIGYTVREVSAVPFSEASAGLSEKTAEVPVKEYTLLEKLWVRVLANMSHNIAYRQGFKQRKGTWSDIGRRNILIGVSGASFEAWTDGATYVCFDRKFLRSLTLSLPGLLRAGMVLWHEYCHDENDSGSHKHGLEFYQAFHDGVDSATAVILGAVRNLPSLLKNAARRLTARQLKEVDTLEAIDSRSEVVAKASEFIQAAKVVKAVKSACAEVKKPKTRTRELTDL